MIKQLKKTILLTLALTIALHQTTTLVAMPRSTKIILGATFGSIGTTLGYGFLLYKKESHAAHKKPTLNGYYTHLIQLLTNKETRSAMHKTHPEFTALVVANSALLTVLLGKTIKDAYVTKPTEIIKTPTTTIRKEDLLPPTKPFSELTLEERGNRMEAQKKVKGEEPLSYDPTKKSENVNLAFERPDFTRTEEEQAKDKELYFNNRRANGTKTEQETQAEKEKDGNKKPARFALSFETDQEWFDHMNQAATQDGMPLCTVTPDDVTLQDVVDWHIDDSTINNQTIEYSNVEELKNYITKISDKVFNEANLLRWCKTTLFYKKHRQPIDDAHKEKTQALLDHKEKMKASKTKEEITAQIKKNAKKRFEIFNKRNVNFFANSKKQTEEEFIAANTRHAIDAYYIEKIKQDLEEKKQAREKAKTDLAVLKAKGKLREKIELEDNDGEYSRVDIPVEILEPKTKKKK